MIDSYFKTGLIRRALGTAVLLFALPAQAFEQEPPPAVRPPALIEPAAGAESGPREQAMFRNAARGSYAEAAADAQALVAALSAKPLTPTQQLADALNNLGALQYRNDDFAGAITSYQKAVDLLSDSGSFRNPLLATPLFGLGVSLTAAGEHAAAVDTLRRAIFITRADRGLQSTDQLQHDNALMQSLLVTGKLEEALERQKVRLTIMEQALGKTPELIPAIDEASHWYRVLQQYEDAAQTLEKKVEILEAEHGEKSIAVVDAYRELAQAYDRSLGPELDKLRLLMRRDDSAFAFSSNRGFSAIPNRRLQEELDQPTPREQKMLDYERYALSHLKKALRIQEDHPDTPPAEMALTETLIGDHYQATGSTRNARRYYKRAYKRLQKAGDTATIDKLYGAPTPLYRRPMRQPNSNNPAVLIAYSGAAQLKMTVTKTGKARDVELVSVSPDDAKRLEDKIVRNARKTIFRPQFSPRGPVDAENVTLNFPLLPAPKR